MQTDWNIVNAIGCWFGGIATAVAAFIAWWQFKQNSNKSIKLKVNYQLLFLSHILGGRYIGSHITLKIMNVGSKKITIAGLGIHTKKTDFAIINLQRSINLPVTIEPSDSQTLSIPVIDLYKELTKHIVNKLLKENTKLTFFVQDNFDEIYKIKTKITYKQIKGYATMKNDE